MTSELSQDSLPTGIENAVQLPEESGQAFDVWFGYNIGSHHFVLDKSLLTEIVIRPPIYAIPRSPAWLHGVINLRGNILAVIDLSESLSTTYRSNPGEYVLVIDKGADALALIVDSPPKSLINPEPAPSPSAGNGFKTDFIQAGVQSENILWMQLDAKALVKSLGANTWNQQ